jgi:hypothetical protein
MDIDQIRRWVRRELPPGERTKVGRWLMRTADPRVADVLHGLIREWEDERADEVARRRAPQHAWTIDLYGRLLELGHAVFDVLREPGIAGGALLGPVSGSSNLSFRGINDKVVVDLAITEPEADVAVFGTTDRGDQHLLYGPETVERGALIGVAEWEPDPSEGRVTIWLAIAPARTVSPQDLGDLRRVAELEGRGEASLVAFRWLRSG